MTLLLAVGPAGSEIFLAGGFRHLELLEQHRRVGKFEIVPRIFLLRLQEHVAISDLLIVVAAVEVEREDIVDALHIHCESLKPVSEFAGNRCALKAGDLLEISELRDFHAIAPAFPAESPRAERRAFPIVFDKTNVVDLRIDADRFQRIEIQILDVRRRRLQDHLKLVVVLQPVRIFAIAAILGTPRRLHISGIPRLRPERAQRGGRMERARSNLHIVGLQNDAAPVRPVLLQRKNEPLERPRRVQVGLMRALAGTKFGFSHRMDTDS